MNFIFEGLNENQTQLYKKVASHIPFNSEKEYTISFCKGNEIALEKSGDKIKATYVCDCQIGRCILNAALMIKENIDTVNEKSYFNEKGVMLDMSRAGVMTVEKVKEYFEYMSLMGLNSAMLYMEDTYEVEGYPYFGYLRGRYTKEELKEIDSYGAALNIEVIPCIQTLGHFEQYLKWAEAWEIRDASSVLLLENEDTYKFIEQLIKTVSECFATKKIHIGMDEAWDLGFGNYFKKNGYKDGVELFTEHIVKVNEIVLKYGLEPMMWSDMYFRLSAKNHGYYETDFEFSEKSKSLLPDNMRVVYWDYYHTDEEFYDNMIQKHKELTDKIVFAGGISIWYGFAPDEKITYETTTAGLSSCRKNGIKDIYATCWGDDGCETDVMFTLPGLILYGEHSYTNDVTLERINKICELITGVSYDDFMELSNVLFPLGSQNEDGSRKMFVKELIYSDPLVNQVEKELMTEGLTETFDGLYNKYNELSKTALNLKEHLNYIALLCRASKIDVEILRAVRKGYDEGDKKLLKSIDFDAAINAYDELRLAHYNLWNDSYKPHGFENLDIRYGGKITRLKTAKMRINDFADGKIEDLTELKDEKLMFTNQRVSYNRYKEIATPYHVKA